LVGCLSSISTLAGRGVEAVPLITVPLGGIGPATILRDLFDLDAWLLRTGKGAGMQFSKTKESFWGLARSGGGGGVKDMAPLWGDRVLRLPADWRNPCRQFMRSLAPVPPLPCKFPPLRDSEEKDLIHSMMAEIKNQYGVQIDETPHIEHGPVTQAEEGGWWRLVLVGAS
jgi:hypothetical protein